MSKYIEPRLLGDQQGSNPLGGTAHEVPRKWPLLISDCGLHQLPARRLDAARFHDHDPWIAPGRKRLMSAKKFLIVTMRGVGYTCAEILAEAERRGVDMDPKYPAKAWAQFVDALTPRDRDRFVEDIERRREAALPVNARTLSPLPPEEEGRLSRRECYDFTRDFVSRNWGVSK